MKVTITQDFESVEAAAEFLARVGNPMHVVQNIVTPLNTIGDYAAVAAGEPKPPRKPRADAGKPRGPHKNTDAAPAAPAAQAQEAQRAEPVPPPAPATPTVAAPAPTGAGEKAVTPASAPAAAAPTLDDARAAMKTLNDTKGKGMDACIDTLRKFGVNRISDLPKDQIGAFITVVRDQVVDQNRVNALAKGAK